MKSQDQKVKVLLRSGGTWIQLDGGNWEYRSQAPPMHRLLLLPSGVTYGQLISMVAKKLNLVERPDGFKLSYKMPPHGVIVELADDDDVSSFIDDVNMLEDMITLFVVESGGFVGNRSNTMNNITSHGREIVQDINAQRKMDYSDTWLDGCPIQSFSRLAVYCHNLKKSSPGTVTHIKTDDMGRFEQVFVAIGCLVQTFMRCLRPLIIIDGAPLKNKFVGTLFLAIAIDGNNEILPIAYGVAKVESEESWTLFFTRLKECIGEVKNLTIISDWATFIDLAIGKVFPTVYHGICCRHVSTNLPQKSKKPKENEWLFWKTCRTYKVLEFEENICALRCKQFDNKQAKGDFPLVCYNVTNSKIGECVRLLSKEAQKLPIMKMIDFFRMKLQRWCFVRHHAGARLQHALTPWAETKIQKRMKRSATWRVFRVADHLYQVQDRHKNNTVDMLRWSCSCGKWQSCGLPCGHVISTVRSLGDTDCNKLSSRWFTSKLYRASYDELIDDMEHPSKWEVPDEVMIVKPPVMENQQTKLHN